MLEFHAASKWLFCHEGEGGGCGLTPSCRKGHARGPDRKWNSRSGKKYFFFGEGGIFFAKLAFSAVIYGIWLNQYLI
jgi:hypothetical protein